MPPPQRRPTTSIRHAWLAAAAVACSVSACKSPVKPQAVPSVDPTTAVEGTPKDPAEEMSDACGNEGEPIRWPVGSPDGRILCKSPKSSSGCGEVPEPRGEGDNACCTHEDCDERAAGTCVVESAYSCGGMPPDPMDVRRYCAYDQCVTDDDCEGDGWRCLPARTMGNPVALCFAPQCAFDSDCKGGTNGRCQPFFDECPGNFIGFFCTYEESACRTSADCPRDQYDAYCLPGQGDGDTKCILDVPKP